MFRKAIIPAAILLLVGFCPANAQSRRQATEPADSVISLLNAEWAKLTKIGFSDYRIIKGPAAFFHNGAYMFCDSAAWDINRDIIRAYGKVRIVQDKTILRSDSLTYNINESLAQFRGPLVDVFDNEGDTLRTNNLDYNTKDSLAIFRRGGAMKDKDGNVIESNTGIYSSSVKTFSFQENVQMFTDSIFVRTEKLDYLTEERKAYFRDKTYVWRDDGFIKALAGWYDTENEVINFNRDVYIRDPEYELWADDVYYYRNQRRYEAYHNVQVLDTLNESAFVAHKAVVVTDSLNNQMMDFTESPALFYFGENEEHVKDSLFVAADSLRMYTVRRNDIPKEDMDARMKERDDILFDAVAEAEVKAEEARQKAIADAEAKKPENVARQRREKIAAKNTVDSLASLGIAASDSLYKAAGLDSAEERDKIIAQFGEIKGVFGQPDAEAPDNSQAVETPRDTSSATRSIAPEAPPQDSTAATGATRSRMAKDAGGAVGSLQTVSDSPSVADSTGMPDIAAGAPADTTAAMLPGNEGGTATGASADTTKIKFLQGWPNVKIYRSDIQLLCDSLAYSDIDSLARLHGDPVMWYKKRNQLTSDIMMLLMKDDVLYRGSMQQNAMLVMQEDPVHFDQIKSPEMLGHFRDQDLYRYDALGGVNAMFYLKEKEEITTINIKSSRFMSMALKDGVAQRIKYYEQTQSDAYPVYNLDIEKQRIKGFNWRGNERPESRYAVTRRSLKPSEADMYKDVEMPRFRFANRYFDRYMSNIYEEIVAREIAKEQARAMRDSLDAVRDSSVLAPADTLLSLPDSVAAHALGLRGPAADSLQVGEGATVADETAAPTAGTRGRGRSERVAAETSETVGAASDKTSGTIAEPAEIHRMTGREKRALRRAERMIRRNDKRFFKKLEKDLRRR